MMSSVLAPRFFVLGSFVQACCWAIDRLPKAGESFVASGVTVEAGGKGLNVAICTKRLGAQVAIALGVGRDHAADELHALLVNEGIGAKHVHALDAQSAYGAGLIAADGQNVIAVFPGPNMMLNAQHILQAKDDIASADLVYGQFETSAVAVEQSFLLACHYGVLTVLNPSPWQVPSDGLLATANIIIVNEVEAAFLLDCEINISKDVPAVLAQLTVQANQFYRKWNGRCLVVTLGALGSVAILPDGRCFYQSAFFIQSVDTVGAGDGFSSGFCMQLAHGAAIEDCLRYGNACGALVAETLGVLDALPSSEKVNQFMQTHQQSSQSVS